MVVQTERHNFTESSVAENRHVVNISAAKWYCRTLIREIAAPAFVADKRADLIIIVAGHRLAIIVQHSRDGHLILRIG